MTKRRLSYFTFLMPVLLFFVGFIVIPFIQGIPIAFTDWNGFGPTRNYVGLANFQRMLTDRAVPNAAGNSLEFTFFTVVFSNGLGLILSLLLYKSAKLNNFLRTIIFMPFVISLVISAIVWRYIYSDVMYPMFGVFSPLANPNTVMMGLAIISVWRDAGYCMIIFIAGLQSIPLELYESAQIEGAGAVRKFFHITIPLLVPAFTANITLILSWGLKMFDYSMAATQGGPGRASETMSMVVFRNIFNFSRAGYGQAFAIVFTIFLFVVSSTVARTLRRREVEL